MSLRISYQRASISVVLAIAVATVFTLRSFAAPEVSKGEVDPTVVQDCTGTLTVKSGSVTINGNAAQTGATVMTGSTLSTSSNGNVIVDLGAAGRVELGDHTTATITCAGGLVQIRTNCSKTEVEVRKGTLNVTQPSTETLIAGKKQKYGGSIDANAAAGIDVKVECEGRKAGGYYTSAGVLGLLALIGVGAAVAVGIGVGGGSESSTPTSPIR